MRILARINEAGLREAVAGAAAQLEAELTVIGANGSAEAGHEHLLNALRTHPTVLLVEAGTASALPKLRSEARARNTAMVLAYEAAEAAELTADGDEWLLLPTTPEEVAGRVRTALHRLNAASRPETTARMAEHLRYEEMLFDRSTGFPTLPVMLERGRELLEETGRMTVMYIEFVRYSKLEEIYGWQKLDEVLQTTAQAVREFYENRKGKEESLLMVSHTGDDDFILFTHLKEAPEIAEQRINEIAQALEQHIQQRLEEEQGEDIAGLFEIYIGATTLFRNPKVRTSRLIYRGIREAAQAARSVEHRERSRKVEDLRATLREDAVYIVYHPIVVTDTEEVFGYEALARGSMRGLRSPEVLFGVAEEANLIWELSRLCRRRAVEGVIETFEPHQLLFLNIDPHDFRDPTFRSVNVEQWGVKQPERIVLEITERTAITDYPKFQGYLAEFRERGFRFAVDDAGSGYAGLGSIANLSPDFIKLDISLISGIDTNFMKQNLVQTMVSFSNDHGIKVIAEGVERVEEYETVKGLGVHLTQGFYFHKPRFMAKQEQS